MDAVTSKETPRAGGGMGEGPFLVPWRERGLADTLTLESGLQNCRRGHFYVSVVF